MYDKRKLTEIALGCIEENCGEYDREDIALSVASQIANSTKEAFGSACSLESWSKIKDAYYQIALESIRWTSLNMKANRKDYEDELADNLWKEGERQ